MNEALEVLLSPAGAVWVVPLVLVVSAHFLAEPLRWRLYLGRGSEAGLVRLVQIFSLTAFIGYTMPLKMGLPARIWLLNGRAGIPFTRLSGLLVLDGLMFYSAWGLSACLALAAFSSHLALSPSLRHATVGGAIVLLALLAAWILWSRRAGTVAGEGRLARIRGRIESVRTAARETAPRAVWAAAVVAGLDVGSQIVRHHVMLALCGVTLDPGAVALVTCVSMFVGLVSLMPMGLGGYDVTLVLLLSHMGVAAEVGVLVALINRVVTIGVGSGLGIWGGIALGLHPLRRGWRERIAGRKAGSGGQG